MSATDPSFEYDIFISYRQNDNRSGWVTEFVNHLKEELAATIKEPVSVYFDVNPHDGLLETHDVDDSLKEKLKCLIFIPIISQTYCDPRSFAWKNEFLAFKKMAEEEAVGLKLKLQNGNVASRILPVRIHELDERDRLTIEREIGALRAIDFIYKSAGVNRPLLPIEDRSQDNLAKTSYRDQINKVANAVKEIIYAQQANASAPTHGKTELLIKQKGKRITPITAFLLLITAALIFFYLNRNDSKTETSEIASALDRADGYFDEAARFDDDRYLLNAIAATRKVLAVDPMNERAMFMLTMALGNRDSSNYYHQRIVSRNENSFYGFLIEGGMYAQTKHFKKTLEAVKKAEALNANDKDLLRLASYLYLASGDYLTTWKYAKRYEKIYGKALHDILTVLYLELGDFKAARAQLELKQRASEFSCDDMENFQKIFLCEGNFEKLEHITDSICSLANCKECPFWMLRAKMHVGKFKDAYRFVSSSLGKTPKITWRYPAYVLSKIGKKDSAALLAQSELTLDKEQMADTSNHHTLYLYSMASIQAMRGNYKEAIKWLREYASKGFALGSEWYILHDPLFDEMQKNNEHFGDMMQLVQKAQSSKLSIREKIRALEDLDKKQR